MKNMKVSKKLLTSFIIVISLAILVGALGIFGMMQIHSYVDTLYNNQVVPMTELSFAREYFQRLRSEQRNLIINSGDSAAIASIRGAIQNQHLQFNTHMENFRPHIVSEEARVLFEEAMREVDAYVSLLGEVAAAAERDGANVEVVREIASGAAAHARPAEAAIVGITELRVAQAETVFNESDVAAINFMIIIAVVLLAAVVLSFIIAKILTGMIVPPLRAISTFFERAAAKGDLAFERTESEVVDRFKNYRDELGLLSASVEAFMAEIKHEMEMLGQVAGGDLTITPNVLSDKDIVGKSLKGVVDNLNDMFGEINIASAQVSSGAQQIADGSQTLAQGSTEQAATVQQLLASAQEIGDKTKANAQMAGKAAELAITIKGNAEKGSKQMDDMVVAVNEISQASQSISKVIKVIDDIAFQTNILALNAAVEAARAGVHGKGFAVVADEVRTLAAKSAEAAKDTGELISNSMEKSEYGARVAKDTAESLAEIVAGINESSAIIGEIAMASESQTAGIGQINSGIDQVATVVQQNSATAEESAAAAEELSGQSAMLEGLIARFKLRSGSAQQGGAYAGNPQETGFALR